MNGSTKERVLQALLQAKKDDYISGAQLATFCDVSRTSIWKAIQSLEQDGYTIVSAKTKGYRLDGDSDFVDAAHIEPYLQTKEIGRTIVYKKEVTSTQTVASELVKENTPHGTIVIAESQTAGRGRMERPWETTAAKGIWMTVVLRPDIPPHQAPQFTLVAAVAVINAMKALYPSLEPVIKWPNDILIGGKKTTGILTEMLAESDRVNALLVGIGINMNQAMSDFPDELQTIATSLAVELGHTVDRAELVAMICSYLENYTQLYVKHGFSRLKTLWEESSGTIGKRIRATTLREVLEGIAIGITEDGVLQLQLDSGEVRGIYSADIELT
ncbi:biotin--[acetyl-CoA-carboxylase] ligase [Caryophanon latum]|uniref:Bifunctional ligase/repressor BirA n=1 Tax=Caryophanon latum TaxID=33977 RepID=A0A1C0YQK6_9BACL|nr:biotin--[acetyl-CoA-carboxylase] ligase [Caryophanon latum]OCS89447.1 biotin--[acetyl-CoA-carboxylase] ligase [Caryophanon latum]